MTHKVFYKRYKISHIRYTIFYLIFHIRYLIIIEPRHEKTGFLHMHPAGDVLCILVEPGKVVS